LPYLIGGSFPWSFVALFGARGRRREPPADARRPVVFLVLWIALPTIFFSLSRSKLPQYILPVVAAVAVLTAWIATASPCWRRGIRFAALGWVFLSVLLLAAANGLVPIRSGVDAEMAAAIHRAAWALGILTLVAGVTAWLASRYRDWALVALSLPLVLLPVAAGSLIDEIARQRSGKELALALRPYLTPDTVIIGIETFSPSLTFYLERSLILSSSTGDALRSNYIRRFYQDLADADSSTLRSSGLWRQALAACDKPTIFLLDPAYRAERALLEEAGLPLIFENRKLVAMGALLRRTLR